MVLNSYFLKHKAYHIIKNIVKCIWIPFICSMSISVFEIAREERKISQTTLCFLLSIHRYASLVGYT